MSLFIQESGVYSEFWRYLLPDKLSNSFIILRHLLPFELYCYHLSWKMTKLCCFPSWRENNLPQNPLIWRGFFSDFQFEQKTFRIFGFKPILNFPIRRENKHENARMSYISKSLRTNYSIAGCIILLCDIHITR